VIERLARLLARAVSSARGLVGDLIGAPHGDSRTIDETDDLARWDEFLND
jgi:hypothetical protein